MVRQHAGTFGSSVFGIRQLPIATGVTASLPATAVPGFFRVGLPPGMPPGDYLVFLALTAPEAFADGVADPGGVIAVATAALTVRP